ncbi:MAG: hypothetical protein ACR2GQ_02660 [Gemmatimonadota bacterium]
MSPRVVLLGPPSSTDALSATLADVAPTGPVAIIRAGWQEMEAESGSLADALGPRAVPLALHARTERVWSEDPDLMAAHRALQQNARVLRRAYNIRLSSTMGAWAALGRQEGPDHLLGPERTATLETVRELDERQRRRIGEIRAEFTASTRPGTRPAVQRERAEIEGLLDGVGTVVLDGGHVAVLLNRIRLFGVDALLAKRTTVGISGGAMVLTDRLVLFHDTPPWGPGHAEVAESGLGLAPGLVVLPHAARRLQLTDPLRVGRLARRFAPAECIALDDGARLDFDGTSWHAGSARRLTAAGEVIDRDAAA